MAKKAVKPRRTRKPKRAEAEPGQAGGSGGDCALPASISPTGIRDTRLIERAMRERWPIVDPAVKEALLQRQIDISLSKEVEPRESTSAYKAVMEATKINLEVLKLEKDKEVPQVNVNVGIQVVQREDFYGAIPAHAVPSEANGASGGSAAIAGPVQDADLR